MKRALVACLCLVGVWVFFGPDWGAKEEALHRQALVDELFERLLTASDHREQEGRLWPG